MCRKPGPRVDTGSEKTVCRTILLNTETSSTSGSVPDSGSGSGVLSRGSCKIAVVGFADNSRELTELVITSPFGACLTSSVASRT